MALNLRGWTELSRKSLVVAQFSVVVAVVVLVYIYQGDRAKKSDIYYTSDPLDNTRHGAEYTCGCSLPAPLQTVRNPHDESQSRSNWNVCYDASSLETVNILMYPNFTGVNVLESVLQDAYSENFNTSRKVKTVRGVQATQQAHDLAWGGNHTFFADYFQEFPELYLGGFRAHSWNLDILKLINRTEILDFPSSYLTMTFVYTCHNCSSCSLRTVNEIFTDLAGNHVNSESVPWGQCAYLDDGFKCNETNSYQARCAVYPEITPLPLVFAVQKFFTRLLKDMKGVGTIVPPNHLQDRQWLNYSSLLAAELYMNLRLDNPGMVELSSFEIEKGSSAWLSLLDSFPTLDTECSSLKDVATINGSSVCNVYKNSRTEKFELKCLDMTNQTSCREKHLGMTMNNVPGSVWWDFRADSWLDLMCPPYEFRQEPPYLVLKQTALAMQNNILNEFLESRILSDLWAQESGVCTKTYPNVIRYQPEKGTNATNATVQFMETQCSRSFDSGYCWLTGRYRELTDSPRDPWHEMNASSRSKNTFVCYNVTDEGFGKWFIVTFGILFGWLGTVDLIFKCIDRVLPPSGPEPPTDPNCRADGTEMPRRGANPFSSPSGREEQMSRYGGADSMDPGMESCALQDQFSPGPLRETGVPVITPNPGSPEFSRWSSFPSAYHRLRRESEDSP